MALTATRLTHLAPDESLRGQSGFDTHENVAVGIAFVSKPSRGDPG